MNHVHEISTLSYKETIDLRSTLHVLSNQQFVCSNCLTKYKGRPDHAVMTEKTRKVQACTEIKKEPVFKVRQERMILFYNTCVGNFFSHAMLPWISMYNHFEQGVMPFPGGYMDQPNKVLEAMGIIQSHKNEQILAERQKQKMKRGRHGR